MIFSSSRKAKYRRTRRKAWKTECIEYLGGKCILCGYNGCTNALDFHHKDPKKKDFTIGGARYKTRHNKKKMQAELDKCVLLCCRCHREVHAGVTKLSEIDYCI